MHREEIAAMVGNALRGFWMSENADSQLRNLQVISQLGDNIDDQDFLDAISNAAQSEDFRIRGEACYAISLSHKHKLMPQLKQILRELTLDENYYVRCSAMKAMSKLKGPTCKLKGPTCKRLLRKAS